MQVGIFEILFRFCRSLVQLIFFGTWSFCQKYSIIGKPGQRLNLVLRGVFGATSALTIFYAFRLIPLGDAATLQYTSPIFVVLVARVMIKEPIKLIQILTGVMSVAGAFIISRPEFAFGSNNSSQSVSSADRILGSALGIGSALAMAFATIFIRKLRDVAVPVVIIWFSIVSIPMGLIILVSLKALTVPKLWPHGPLILAMGACGITDQVLLTTALRFEKAGPVAVVRTLIIFLAFVWDILLFSVAIHWTSITGAFLVLSSVMVLALVKMNEENPHLFTCCKFWRNKKASLNDSEINDKSRNSMEEESGIGESYTTVSTISMSHVKQEN